MSKEESGRLHSNSEVVVFQPSKGNTEFQVFLDPGEDTVWATEQQIMDLFGKAKRTIWR